MHADDVFDSPPKVSRIACLIGMTLHQESLWFSRPPSIATLFVCFFFFRRETVSDLLDHMLRDVQLHPDVALVNGISVLLTLLEVRKGR